MSSYLVYICQAVRNRAGLERYWQVAPAVYPENVDLLAGYAPFEVLDADQDERVEGVVIAEFLPFEQTVAWFNGDAYVRARKERTNGNEYLGMVVDRGVVPIGKRCADVPDLLAEQRNHRHGGAHGESTERPPEPWPGGKRRFTFLPTSISRSQAIDHGHDA